MVDFKYMVYCDGSVLVILEFVLGFGMWVNVIICVDGVLVVVVDVEYVFVSIYGVFGELFVYM